MSSAAAAAGLDHLVKRTKMRGRQAIVIEGFLDLFGGGAEQRRDLDVRFTFSIGEETFRLKIIHSGYRRDHIRIGLCSPGAYGPGGVGYDQIKYGCSVERRDTTRWGTVVGIANGNDYSFRAFDVDYLIEKAQDLLPNGCLTIILEIEFVVYRKVEETTTKIPETEEAESLGRNMLAIWNNPVMSDVRIICQERSFPCHKVVLSARSDVFAAMISKDENITELRVDDVESGMMDKLLQFIYTDECEMMSEKEARDLLDAASKYNVVKLVRICQEFLGNISIDNCGEVLVQSCLQDNEKLKKTALNFMLKNLENVKKTEAWKVIKEKHPQVMAELLDFVMIS